VIGLATLGLNRTRIAGWTVSDLVFLFAGGIVCLKLLSGRTADLAPPAMRKSSPPILLGTLVLVIAGTLSSFQSFEPMTSIVMVVRIVWITLAWFWVLRAVSPNRDTLHRLLRGFRITVVVSCLGGLAGYLGFVALTPANRENREAAFFNHPNELGGLIAMALPFIVLGVLQTRGRRGDATWRRLALAMLAIFALGTTGSITAFLSAIAGGCTLVAVLWLTSVDRPRRRRSPLPYMFGAMALAGGVLWLAGSELPVVERFTQIGAGGDVSDSIGSREELNAYVINNLDNSLIVGVGLDADTRSLGDETGMDDGASRVHNLYLKLLYEAGVPGLVGLFIVIATAFRQSWRLVVNTRGTELYPTAVALLSALVTVNVFALFQPLFVQRYYWLPVGLVGVLWALRRQESSEEAGAAPPQWAAARPRRPLPPPPASRALDRPR
jgi:O-antigen ligase